MVESSNLIKTKMALIPLLLLDSSSFTEYQQTSRDPEAMTHHVFSRGF